MPTTNFSLRNAVSVCAFVAMASLVVAACQPSDHAAERVGRDIDQATQKLSEQADKAADKTGVVLAKAADRAQAAANRASEKAAQVIADIKK